MPNIITHTIFAEEVYKNCRKKDIKEIMEKHLQIFYIGANGPDFLFYHHMKPWETYKDHTLNHIGSRLHKGHVNDFYKSAVSTIQAEKDAFVKESELVYVMGHLCHWALDMKTHPYIFYRTGNCKGKSAALHHRFESMTDTMMLQRYRQKSICDYRCYEICEYDEEMLKAIARIYVKAVKDSLNQSVKVHELREALDSWYDILKMLYDPECKKTKVVKAMEKVIAKPWLVSGYIIPKEGDETYDILNLNKQSWLHPCDQMQVSNASFLELFEEAKELAMCVIEKVYGCVEYDADVNYLCKILKDRAYDTGREGGVEMKYFDVIYDETV